METKEFKDLSVGTVVDFNGDNVPMIVCLTYPDSIVCNTVNECGKYLTFRYSEKDSKSLEIISDDSLMALVLMDRIKSFGYDVSNGIIFMSDKHSIWMDLYSEFVIRLTSGKVVDKVILFTIFFAINYLFFGVFVGIFGKLNFLGNWWLSTLSVTLIGYLSGYLLYIPFWKYISKKFNG